ncbi:MAG: hypothetical protein L6R42_009939 [Xanthoria sp. 1 TBL-2021]|nr:MAG: hypothetical protein L6R42_009939 [Xanthoria sp. 1 TBL-2021]
MPTAIEATTGPAKRKRHDADFNPQVGHKSKTRKIEKDVSQRQNTEEEILLLEGEITQSRKHYNKITILLDYCKRYQTQSKTSIIAAVALCRVFCRLIAIGSMSQSRGMAENEKLIAHWLRVQCDSYRDTLLGILLDSNPGMQSTALTLLMRLQKEMSDNLDEPFHDHRRNEGGFCRIIASVTRSNSMELIREEFVEKYVQPYDDVRYYTLACLK